jgi:acylphosphatase
MTQRRVAVTVSGLVQGVFFRSEIEQRAQRLGLSGWVRNLPDGRLGAEFQGSPEAVEEMLAFCRRGPQAAEVNDVEVNDVAVREGDMGFAVR